MSKIKEKNCDLAIFSIVSLIKDYGALSQSDLSKLSGYSRSTISINCDKLLQKNYISLENADIQNKKKNIKYSLNVNLGVIIGIGIGGTTCRIGIYNILCELIEIVRLPIDLIRGPDATLNLICKNIDILLKKYSSKKVPLLGIGMGIPTPVKYEEGVAFHPAFMPGWHLFNLKEYFSDKYNCPIYIDNEVNTMALEEYISSNKEDLKTLLCIKIGTGIGAGIIINKQIFRGENGGGGNIGHIQMDNITKVCTCGKIGCIESVASVPAIIETALIKRQSHPNSLLNKIESDELTLSDIKNCADKGDRLSLTIIEEAGTIVGQLIGKITTFLDPGIIKIVGRATILGPNYLYYIRNSIQKEAAPWIGPEFNIDFSKLTEDSAATGATRLCINELFDRQLIFNQNPI